MLPRKLELGGRDLFRLAFLLLCITFVTVTASEQEPQALRLMPWPQSVKATPGQLVIQNSFTLSVPEGADPQLRRAAAIFLDDLRKHTGSLPLDFGYAKPEGAQLRISVEHASKGV